MVEVITAGLIMASMGWLMAQLVDQACFHNFAGTEVADPSSPRGKWCEAIAGRSAWQIKLIVGAFLLGSVIHLLPLPRIIRWSAWCGTGILAVAILAYFMELEYTVNRI